MNNNIKAYNFLYKVLLVFFFLILFGYFYDIESVVRIGTYGILFHSIGLFCMGIICGYIRISDVVKVFVLLVISLFSVFISGEINFNSLVKILMFIELPLLIISLPPKIDKTVIQFYQKLFFLLALFCIYFSFTELAHTYKTKYGITQISALTLGVSNPNETAMFLFIVLFALLYSLFTSKRKFLKCCLALCVAYIAYLIYLTECRVVVLLTAVLLVITLFFRKKKPDFVLERIVQIIPYVFVGFMILFADVLSSVILMNDVFNTGRSSIYLSVFNNMSFSKFIVGDFTFNFQNLHNAPLAIFATIGIVGVVVFYDILFSKLSYMLKTASNCRKGYLAFWTILLLVLHSSVEAALFTAGSALSMCTFIVFLFARYEVSDEDITN